MTRTREPCPSRRSGLGWCALGVVGEDDLRPLHEAAAHGRDAYTAAFFAALAANPMLNKVLPFVLYETLGPTCPTDWPRPPFWAWPRRLS